MGATITIDTSEYNRKIRKFAAEAGKDIEAATFEEMGNLVTECIQNTPPFGVSSDGKKQGEGAVKRDVEKIFIGVNGNYLQKWGRKFQNLTTSGGGHPLFDERVDPKFHQEFRDRNGRVRRKGSRLIRVPPLEFADKVHVMKGQLASYIRAVQAHVGQAKAGWMAAAVRFRARRIPAWVSRHGPKDGTAMVEKTPNGITLTAINSNKAISYLNASASIVRRSVAGRVVKLTEKIRRVMDYNSRKWSRL